MLIDRERRVLRETAEINLRWMSAASLAEQIRNLNPHHRECLFFAKPGASSPTAKTPITTFEHHR